MRLWVAHAQGHRDTLGRPAELAAEMDIVKPLEVRVFSSAERLVSPEAHDGQTEGVHGKLIVLHVLAKDISDCGCPSFPFEFRVISWIRVHLFELNPSRIRRLPQVIEDYV